MTLSANAGSSAKITPASGISTATNGAVVFSITDAHPETSTFTARDTTDGITLTQTAQSSFVVPPGAAAGIDAFPTSVTNNGVSRTTITVTLKDSLGRPSPGKLVMISQGSGNSVIKGPLPAVTNSSGQIEFTATDLTVETVTYSATDVTDGNLAFPGTAIVSFSGNPANSCVNGNPLGASGFGINPFATGFTAGTFFYGDVNWGCSGAWGMAFDAAKNLYVADFVDGNIYKFGASGGAAGPGTLLTTITPTAGGLTMGKDGNLYVGIAASSSSFFQGSILQIDAATGKTLKTIATNVTCPYNLATDPLSGDIFVDDGCSGAGSDNPTIWRISNLSSPSPTMTLYATLPNTPNFQMSFAPNGTLYVTTGTGAVAQVSGTNTPSPPTVTTLLLNTENLGLAARGTDSTNQSLIASVPANVNFPNALMALDLSQSSPAPTSIFVNPGLGNVDAIGPDGCLYAAQNDTVYRITDSSGSCPFTSANPAPSLSLKPAVIAPNPAQGAVQSFTAIFHYLTVPGGTPVFIQVIGANPQTQMAPSNIFPSGQASFSYPGVNAGQDTIVASATIGTQTFTSQPVTVTWTPGLHSTFLSLNQSPTVGMVKKPTTFMASLTDVSVSPVAPIKGATIQFVLEATSCSASTDAKGNASCSITPPIVGAIPLVANYAGSPLYVPTTASIGINVAGPPTFVPTFTPRPSGTPTMKPTPTPTQSAP